MSGGNNIIVWYYCYCCCFLVFEPTVLGVVVLIDGGKYDELLAVGGEIDGWCGVCFIVEGSIGVYFPYSSLLVVGVVDLLFYWRMLSIPGMSF
jgi:hypothetical protein